MIETFAKTPTKTERIWKGERSGRLPPDVQHRAFDALKLVNRVRSLDTAYRTEKSLGNSGACFNGVHFPEGTEFRATYKGHYTRQLLRTVSEPIRLETYAQTHRKPRHAITVNDVNGWRFWHAILPGEGKWQRLDEYVSRIPDFDL